MNEDDADTTLSKRIVNYFLKVNTKLQCICLLEGKITRGRPRTDWMTNIKEWTGTRYIRRRAEQSRAGQGRAGQSRERERVRLAQDRDQ